MTSSVEQRDEGVGVALLERRGETGDDLPHACVADVAQRLLLACGPEPSPRRSRGLAPGQSSRTRSTVFIIVRDLGGREAENLEEQQRRPLVARQVLQRGDEGELDGFALLVARVRAGRTGRQADVGVGARATRRR